MLEHLVRYLASLYPLSDNLWSQLNQTHDSWKRVYAKPDICALGTGFTCAGEDQANLAAGTLAITNLLSGQYTGFKPSQDTLVTNFVTSDDAQYSVACNISSKPPQSKKETQADTEPSFLSHLVILGTPDFLYLPRDPNSGGSGGDSGGGGGGGGGGKGGGRGGGASVISGTGANFGVADSASLSLSDDSIKNSRSNSVTASIGARGNVAADAVSGEDGEIAFASFRPGKAFEAA